MNNKSNKLNARTLHGSRPAKLAAKATIHTQSGFSSRDKRPKPKDFDPLPRPKTYKFITLLISTTVFYRKSLYPDKPLPYPVVYPAGYS